MFSGGSGGGSQGHLHDRAMSRKNMTKRRERERRVEEGTRT